jgi:hypothetical protein
MPSKLTPVLHGLTRTARHDEVNGRRTFSAELVCGTVPSNELGSVCLKCLSPENLHDPFTLDDDQTVLEESNGYSSQESIAPASEVPPPSAAVKQGVRCVRAFYGGELEIASQLLMFASSRAKLP